MILLHSEFSYLDEVIYCIKYRLFFISFWLIYGMSQKKYQHLVNTQMICKINAAKKVVL